MPKVQSRKRPRRRRRPTQKGGVLGTILKESAKIGYTLGKDPRYKRMGAKGATGHYKSTTADWTPQERAAFHQWQYDREQKEHKSMCCLM